MEPELLPGPQKGECRCGCGRFGAIKKNGCVRGCGCRSCVGRRSRAKGQRAQRAAQKTLNMVGPGKTLGANHEENWTGTLRVEVKSGGFAKPVATKYRLAEAQSEAARAYGDHRPFIFVAKPDGDSDALVVCRLSRLVDVATAVIEQHASQK